MQKIKKINTLKSISKSISMLPALLFFNIFLSHATTIESSITKLPGSVIFPDATYTVFDSDGFPQPARTAYKQGEDGITLPPKSQEAAKYWPPEFRMFFDSALAIFKRGGREPSIEELEQILNIRLSLLPETGRSSATTKISEFTVSGITFEPQERTGWEHRFNILENLKTHTSKWQFTVVADPSRFCINPYEIAIYLGEEFSGVDMRLHMENLDAWPPSYKWGLFKRGSQGIHLSNSVWISTQKQIINEPYRDPGCINSLVFFGTFNKK